MIVCLSRRYEGKDWVSSGLTDPANAKWILDPTKYPNSIDLIAVAPNYLQHSTKPAVNVREFSLGFADITLTNFALKFIGWGTDLAEFDQNGHLKVKPFIKLRAYNSNNQSTFYLANGNSLLLTLDIIISYTPSNIQGENNGLP